MEMTFCNEHTDKDENGNDILLPPLASYQMVRKMKGKTLQVKAPQQQQLHSSKRLTKR